MSLESCKSTKEREVYIQSYPIGNGIAWAGFWIGIGLMIIGMSSCVSKLPEDDLAVQAIKSVKSPTILTSKE